MSSKGERKQDQKDEPVRTTLGFERNGVGWSVVTLTTQGDRVVSRDLTEPDLMAIARSTFKSKASSLLRGEG